MAIDDLDRIWIRDGDVVGLDAYNFAQPLMSIVDSFEAFTAPALVHKPHVRERCREGRWNSAQACISNVGQDIVKDRQ